MAPSRDHVRRAAATTNLPLDDGQLDALAAFVDLLVRYADHANLVGTSDPRRIADEMVVDSAQLLPLVHEHLPPRADNAPRRLVDIGSGAGLPGIPLLLCLPGWHGLLVEPRAKRATFLRMSLRELGLSGRVRVAESRMEDVTAAVDDPGPHPLAADLWVSKAVFPPNEWRVAGRDLGVPAPLARGFYLQGRCERVDDWEIPASHRRTYDPGTGARTVALLVAPDDRANAKP